MRGRRRIGIAVLTLLTMGVGVVRAQIVISDPALIARDAAIAAVKGHLLDTLVQEAAQIAQMATRLTALTNLHKYAIAYADTPKWRIHIFQGDEFLYANPYNAALNYGDGQGVAFAQVARPRVDAGQVLASVGDEAVDAAAAITAQLATLDAADSTIIEGTDQTGQLRYNGRQETAAIEALQGDTLNPSPHHSATAILDTISGAGLLRARQQQARIQFMTAIVEQLVVENKRARDTEAAAMNMQLGRLQGGTAASARLLAGTTDALRAWRQP